MKTTIEITDALLRRAKATAATEGTTLRSLVEAGLRHELAARQQKAYVLPDASFRGSGTQQGVSEGDWATIRDLAYEGRGA